MDVVVSHVNADFDSLGGLVGAGKLYPGAALVLPGGEGDEVRRFLLLHRDVLETQVPADIDPETITRVIVVDTNARKRLGPAAEWLDLPNVELHLFDHHPGEPAGLEPGYQRVEPWGSVSSILCHQLQARGISLTPVEATAMLLGIYADTGSLSFVGTRPEDLEAAAWLLRQGGDLGVVAEFLHQPLTPEQRQLLADLLDNQELLEVGGVRVLLALAPPGPYVSGAASLAHHLLDLEDGDAVFLIIPMNDQVYVIGRSRSDAVEVGGVVRALGGGGHARAASATLKDGDAAQIKQKLRNELQRHVQPEPTARQLMSYPVRTIAPETTIGEAWQRMIRYGHSGLTVMEGDHLAGVLTRRDVDKARHHQLDHAPVRGFMSTHVHTVAPETPLSDLERTMISEGVGRLPVVEGERVVGILTRTDVLKAMHGSRYLAGAPRLEEETPLQLLRERLPASIQRLLEEVGRVALSVNAEAYVVGGFVRDLLLDVRNLDVDFVVEPEGTALARAFAAASGGEFSETARFGTSKVRLPDGSTVEFATARTETYAFPGALPEVEPSSVVDDLRRRDFTINAMALSVHPRRFGELLDPFGGRADLNRRRIRILHNLSFLEDPTRLFRAIRFEERFHFEMDAHTERQARQAVAEGVLERISPERLRAEFRRTLEEARPLGPLRRAEGLGILRWLHPELLLDQTLLQNVPGALEWWKGVGGEPAESFLVYLTALFAPLPPAEAAQASGTRFRLAPADCALLKGTLELRAREAVVLSPAARPAEVTEALAGAPAEALVLLRAGAGEPETAVLEQYAREWRRVRLAITGDDLKRLGYQEGRGLGRALKETLRARLNGELEGRDAELEFARRVLEQGNHR